MTARTIAVLGDVLLDRDVHGVVSRIAPDAPVPVLDAQRVVERAGGAGLTALLGRGPQMRVRLAAPLAEDAEGRRLRALLAPHVDLLPLGHEGPTRTKTRLRADGQCLLRLDEGGPGTPTALDPATLGALAEFLETADVVLVSDYGAGVTRDPGIRRLLARLAPRTPVVWDPHPRGGDPVPGCLLVTPNLAEARARVGDESADPASELRERWRVRAVCVTAGARGAYLAQAATETLYVPAPVVEGGDPCGAGDCFVASVAVSVARGRVVSEAVVRATHDASRWVASGGASSFAPSEERAGDPAVPGDHDVHHHPRDQARTPALGWDAVERRVRDVRASGGRIIATGGCFDLLHVGHLSCLQTARRVGDTLIVLLNSDASVRRLKGPARPVVAQRERAEMLLALECVDGVIVFDEDDPSMTLARLRPDVWVKGGDYSGAPMPEAELVRGWGGRVLLLPYLSGRSTTGLLQQAAGSR
ncbi:PfkB family carbohydrate kinase [Kineosporia succinea]|uniref:RfaE bifunctional protein nucleotidyltransferase chain/domain/rfaE bifunctional protein kinase chain/domain n=1 Tax=Kineosporia succinea TaxID=84632 RepID=A0ABT9NYH8_9ACTN|nr:PfkB family carbohydrate kinase [Kineosporia succinea]MDP9824900.1 rfaE bifunctional protein nucleotidyltransferase chain/domain/rfaE bifunctional protein kinase chain/domain [Kineosporia succinea]